MKSIIKKTLWGALGLVMTGGLFFVGGKKADAEVIPTIPPSQAETVSASAIVVRSGDYGYEVTSETDKTAALRKIYNANSEVNIPATIDGYKIVQIGTNFETYIKTDTSVRPDYDKICVFGEKDSVVKKLVIPEGVTTICEHAFYELNSLEELTLPVSLRNLNGYNFRNAPNLKKIRLPGYIQIGEGVFNEVDFDEMVIDNALYTGEEVAMSGHAKKVIINGSKVYVSLGNMEADKVIIAKKVSEINLEHITCNSLVLKNPKTKVNIFADSIFPKKFTTVITNIKCKKSAKKYSYSWKPVKIKGQKYSVKYTVKGKNNNGKFKKIKTQKKTAIILNKKTKLRVEASIKLVRES